MTDALSPELASFTAGSAAARTDEITAESEGVRRVLAEAQRVVVGQDILLERLLLGLARRWSHPARGPAGTRQDPRGQDHRHHHRGRLQPGAVHSRPAADRPHRHDDLQPAHQRVHGAAGPDLHQHPAGRRDQPRAGKGAVGAAGVDAGAPGHHRRRDPPPARASSWCWPRRTRSSRRAPTRCPKRRSTASSSSWW